MDSRQSWRIDELEKIVVRALVLLQLGLSLGSLMVPIITISADPPRSTSVGGLLLGLMGMDERPASATVLIVCLVTVLLAALVTIAAMVETVSKDERTPGTIVAAIAGAVSVASSLLALLVCTGLPLRLNSRGEFHSPDVDPTFPGWGLALAAFAGVWALMTTSVVRKLRG
ncbi:MAG TPA: hypothetical protein IAA98_02360 [Candidatus Avipropionibacterium avicola]|uniref:Uncharacterized protein n=1 Tax=Candidatus Avipropionibacterium avicola TaxID=2840701 RepID=A0A9D1GV96_9ACTN|nr:hypothetical protein [Candidatus Avipropionibacterium avicola]